MDPIIIARRTMSSILCDNVPSVTQKWLKLKQSAFKLDSPILTCENILKSTSLDLENIAQEIVKSVGKEYT